MEELKLLNIDSLKNKYLTVTSNIMESGSLLKQVMILRGTNVEEVDEKIKI
jgi:hypothetical protein